MLTPHISPTTLLPLSLLSSSHLLCLSSCSEPTPLPFRIEVTYGPGGPPLDQRQGLGPGGGGGSSGATLWRSSAVRANNGDNNEENGSSNVSSGMGGGGGGGSGGERGVITEARKTAYSPTNIPLQPISAYSPVKMMEGVPLNNNNNSNNSNNNNNRSLSWSLSLCIPMPTSISAPALVVTPH